MTSIVYYGDMAKKLNVSDGPMFQTFDSEHWECIDTEDGIHTVKRTFPSCVNYYFFSQLLKNDHLKSRRRKAEQLIAETVAI